MTETTEKELKTYTMADVTSHNEEKDCWLIIGNANNGGPKVYDVTNYLNDHPGGSEVMLDLGGQNADEFFEDIGHSQDARNELKKMIIGTLEMTEEEKLIYAKKETATASSGGSNMMLIMAVVLVAIILGYMKFNS